MSEKNPPSNRALFFFYLLNYEKNNRMHCFIQPSYAERVSWGRGSRCSLIASVAVTPPERSASLYHQAPPTVRTFLLSFLAHGAFFSSPSLFLHLPQDPGTEGGIMKQAFSAVVACVLCVLVSVEAINSAPEVQVYSREPGDFNKLNTLICYVRNFHPPEIRIELLKNGQEIREARQTDLAFEENWHYHLTKHVPFIPKSGDKYTCRVTHMGNTKVYEWEPDM